MPDEKELRVLLYRAVRELNYIEEMAVELVEARHRPLIASAEGHEIVEDGMKALDVKDLGLETHEYARSI